METPHAAESDLIWGQVLMLNPGLRAGSDADSNYFLERIGGAERFFLNGWQMSLMAEFDRGQKTLGQAVREIYPAFANQMNETAVRQFCQWLFDEHLVHNAMIPSAPAVPLTQPLGYENPSPILEPVSYEAGPPVNPIAQVVNSSLGEMKKQKRSRSIAIGTFLKMAACIGVGIGMWKFTATIWPLVKTPLKHTQSLVMSKVLESQTQSASAAMIPAPQEITLPEDATIEDATIEDEMETGDLMSKLRSELTECQTRRNACYQNDDEEGYREEVHKIAQLTHRLGEIQAKLIKAGRQEETTETEHVAYGS